MGIMELTDESFESALAGHHLVLLDFWAPWCIPCRALEPVLEELARQFQGRVTVAKIDVDACPALRERFAVRSVPTLMLMTQGATPVRMTDTRRLALRARLEEALAGGDTTAPAELTHDGASLTADQSTEEARLASVLESILANTRDRIQASCTDENTPASRLVATPSGDGDGSDWSLRYYQWLVNDAAWGLASHLQSTHERRLLERLKELQALAANGQIDFPVWISLKDEVSAHAKDHSAQSGIDLGPALGTLADFRAGLGLMSLHDYVEGLAVRRATGDKRSEDSVNMSAAKFSLAVQQKLRELMRPADPHEVSRTS